MPKTKFILHVGLIGGLSAAVLLVAELIVAAQIGPDLIGIQSLSLVEFNRLAAGHANQVQLLIMLDDLFVFFYLIAFTGLATTVWDRRALAILGLGSAIVLALFDFLENSLTLGLVGVFLAEQTLNRLPSIEVNHLLALNVIGQMKWLAASVAIGSLGIAIWDTRISQWRRAVSILFLIFVPLAAWGMISSAGVTARVLWMLVLLIAGVLFLWRRMER